MVNYNFLAQICCIGAILIWNISVQNKKLEKILFFQFLANLLYSSEYFLLGATITGFMDLTSGFRCFVFYFYNKIQKPISKKWLLFFIILIILIGTIGYSGPITLIPVFMTLFYTITSYSKTSNWTRIAFLIAAFIWIYYNLQVGAYVGVAGNILEIISGTISIYRFDKKEKAEI